MTTEQLNELADALAVLSSKSSVLKERDELRALMEENLQAEEVRLSCLLTSMTSTNIHRSPSGPQVTLWRSNQTHPIHAHQNRHPTPRI